MTRWARYRLRAIQVITAVLCTGCIGPFSEMIERKYADTKAAKAAGAFVEGGWIPDIVPEDAVDIHEVHDLDVNLTWVFFKTQSVAVVRRDLSGLRATRTKGRLNEGQAKSSGISRGGRTRCVQHRSS